MATIGIISVPMIRKSRIGKFLNSVKITEHFGDTPRYIVAEVDASITDVLSMGRLSKKHLYNKAKKLLLREGADAVLISREHRNGLFDGLYKAEKSYTIPPARIFECFFFALKNIADINYTKKIIILDKRLKSTDFKSVLDISYVAASIDLYTERLDDAERIEKELFYEYGVLINIKKYDKIKASKFSDIMIDVDNATIKINDFCVSGAEFISKSGNYKLEATEEAYVLGGDNMLEIDALLCGKHKIIKDKENKTYEKH